MKQRLLTIALMCAMIHTSRAQIYGYDSWAELPTMSVYDQGMMNMHLRALSQMAARQEAIEAKKSELYQFYCEMALDALQDKEWRNVMLIKHLRRGIIAVSSITCVAMPMNNLDISKMQKQTINTGRNAEVRSPLML